MRVFTGIAFMNSRSALRHDLTAWAVMVQLSGLLIFYGVLPLVISTLSHHHGWSAGRPGFVNMLGLILVICGIAIIV